MNAIQFSIAELKYRLPMQILNAAYKPDYQYPNMPLFNLDESIRLGTINHRVMSIANKLGGQHVAISLQGLRPQYADFYSAVYEIPDDRLAGREIMTPLQVGYLPVGFMQQSNFGYNALGCNNQATVGAAAALYDNYANVPPIANANLRMVAKNTVLVALQSPITQSFFLRCLVANDPELNNIHPRSHIAFAKLVELAVKSYAYNKLVIEIGETQLHGGQDLGIFRDKLNEYSEAEQLFQEYLPTWQKVAIMNDTVQARRLMRLQLRPGM